MVIRSVWKQNRAIRPRFCWNRSALFMLLVSIGCLFFAGCATQGGKVTYAKMGETVPLGAVSHTVLGAEWRPGLGEGATARVPTYQFLILRLVTANGVDSPSEIASVQLVAPNGTEYDELADGSGLPEWLGLARTLSANESRQGNVLFDAPRGVYKLKLTEPTIDGDQADVAMVEIPIRLEDDSVPGSADPTANPIR